MQRNFFSGTIPTELGNLAELHELWMHRLDLSGPIPKQIGELRDMRDLRFQFTSLEGLIPDGLWGLHKLTYDCGSSNAKLIRSSISGWVNR